MEATEETNEEFGSRMMRMLQDAEERRRIEEANSTHFCPICQQQMIFTPRYPNAVCSRCKSKTTDKSGRNVSFRNIDLSGGCEGYYIETLELYDSHECYVGGTQCRADEARFGGIVIEVVLSEPEVILYPALTEEEPALTEEEIEARIDELDRWIELVDKRIYEMLEKLPSHISKKLDGSVSSLSVLENHLLNNYKSSDLFLPQNEGLLNAIISYLGKVYIQNLPYTSYWNTEIHERKSANFGQLSLSPPLHEPIILRHLISKIFEVKTGVSLQHRYERIMSNLRRMNAL